MVVVVSLFFFCFWPAFSCSLFVRFLAVRRVAGWLAKAASAVFGSGYLLPAFLLYLLNFLILAQLFVDFVVVVHGERLTVSITCL